VFKLLKNNLLRLLDETQAERSRLTTHPLYNSIKTEKQLHVFMENHVFAVWDFMSVLKSLQIELTCVDIPWRPKNNGNLSRLINEIVLTEEADIDCYGEYMSHFEIYYHTMKEAGANTHCIEKFLTELDVVEVSEALLKSNSPAPAKQFVTETFNHLNSAPLHICATIFTLGREEIIPDMFRKIVAELNNDSSGKFKPFIYYLDRHIGLDEEEHTPLALKMIKELCGEDDSKWNECIEYGKSVMSSRIKFWDNILDEININ